jgi:hypothetical protein
MLTLTLTLAPPGVPAARCHLRQSQRLHERYYSTYVRLRLVFVLLYVCTYPDRGVPSHPPRVPHRISHLVPRPIPHLIPFLPRHGETDFNGSCLLFPYIHMSAAHARPTHVAGLRDSSESIIREPTSLYLKQVSVKDPDQTALPSIQVHTFSFTPSSRPPSYPLLSPIDAWSCH